VSAPACANCGAPVPDRFCGACGQERRSLHVPFHHLAGEAAGELFSLDARLPRTLAPLFLRPGAVTKAYLEGKRARFTSPVKLYLALSFLFFVVVALAPERGGLDVRAGGAGGVTGAEADGPSAEDLRGVRALPLGDRLSGRLEAIAREPHAEVRRRFAAAFAENAPKAMFVLVPVAALLLRLLYLRAGFYLSEHLVFALHEHAVAFALLLPGAALGSPRLEAGAVALSGVHALLAMRRVYGKRWPGTLARAAALAFLYLLALGLALAAAALAALLAS
jgi:hypothetical protein